MRDRAHHLSISGLLLAVTTLFCWSSVPLFLKHFAKYIDAWTTNGWRYGMSAVFWMPLLTWAMWRRKLPPNLWKAALVPSLFNVGGQICFALVPYYINPGLQSFLLRLQIIFIAMGSYLLFPAERRLLRSPIFWAGIATVFFGSVGIMMLNPTRSDLATITGVVLALCGGLGFACYTLSVKYFMHGIHSVFAFGAVSNLSGVVLVTLMLVLGRNHGVEAWHMDANQFLILFASAMIGIAISHVLYYMAMNRLGVPVSAGVILLQPVIVSIASIYLFNERLTIGQWACGTGALSGTGIMLYAQQRLSRTSQRLVEVPAQVDGLVLAAIIAEPVAPGAGGQA